MDAATRINGYINLMTCVGRVENATLEINEEIKGYYAIVSV